MERWLNEWQFIRSGSTVREYYILATRIIGIVEEFQENDNWIEYTERLEHYFTADQIAGVGKKRAVLPSSCGAKTYKLIRNLVSPGKPIDKTFAELVNIVKNHLNPRPSTIVYRFKFNSRFRQPRESIHQYVALRLSWSSGRYDPRSFGLWGEWWKDARSTVDRKPIAF